MEDNYVREGTTTPFCSWISENTSQKTNGVVFQTKDIVLVASPSDKIQLNSSVPKEDCTWITKRRGGLSYKLTLKKIEGEVHEHSLQNSLTK